MSREFLAVACLVACGACGGSTLTEKTTPVKVTVEKPYFRWLFGGFGFQHPEANFEVLMTDEFCDQRALKSFAEISPTFGRVYTGFAGQSENRRKSPGSVPIGGR